MIRIIFTKYQNISKYYNYKSYIRSIHTLNTKENNEINDERFNEITNHIKYPHLVEIPLSFPLFREKYNTLPSKAREKGDFIILSGRISSIRMSSRKLYFIDIINNGEKIQVLSELQYYHDENSFKNLHESLRRGDIIKINGFPGKSAKGELSIIPKSIVLLSPCIPPIPNSKYGIKDPEIKFRKRYLDLLINPNARSVFVTRAKIIKYIRNYLEIKDFIEVETPILSSGAGGAIARPFKTFSNSLYSELSLRIAPELFLKQLVIGGLEKVFEIGKVFRNEGIDSTHNPEFTICEFYQAYSDYNELFKISEDLITGLVKSITGSLQVEILDNSGDEKKKKIIDFKPPFRRISVMDMLEQKLNQKLPTNFSSTEAFEKLVKICKENNIMCEAPLTASRLLDKLINHYVEPECINPTFLCDHPECMSPLAKQHREKEGLTERFELFVAGKELCNAYTELNDPVLQRKRFLKQKKEEKSNNDEIPDIDDHFCNALNYGLPPTGGFGMGIDRLVMLLTNSKHIREVILFPSMKPVDAQNNVKEN